MIPTTTEPAIKTTMPKLFYVVLYVDNGMERFMWSGYVFAEDEKMAVECVKEQKFDGDIVQVKYIVESHPVNGVILQA